MYQGMPALFFINEWIQFNYLYIYLATYTYILHALYACAKELIELAEN